jgi:hypothetical protein
MQLTDVFKNMPRPKILLKAARICLKTYRRDKELKRLLGAQYTRHPDKVLIRLGRQETELEDARKCGSAAYDMNLHIQVMTALLQELYLLPKET